MARLRRPAPQVAGVPAEVGDQLSPIWRDVRELEAHPVWGAYVDQPTRERLSYGGTAYTLIVSRWAVRHGFESPRHPGLVDWHALREATGG